ncbi:hypothetical protein PYCC9005_002612 [Savitreella phatthalungensis]
MASSVANTFARMHDVHRSSDMMSMLSQRGLAGAQKKSEFNPQSRQRFNVLAIHQHERSQEVHDRQISRQGYDWLRPVGINKTMAQQDDEAREMEESHMLQPYDGEDEGSAILHRVNDVTAPDIPEVDSDGQSNAVPAREHLSQAAISTEDVDLDAEIDGGESFDSARDLSSNSQTREQSSILSWQRPSQRSAFLSPDQRLEHSSMRAGDNSVYRVENALDSADEASMIDYSD